MEVKRMVVGTATKTRRYDVPMKQTPDDEGGFVRTQYEVQQRAIAQAREFADRRGYKGGGFEFADYEKALSELGPHERAAERNLGATTPEEVEARELQVWQTANPHHAKDHPELRHLAKQAIEKRRAYLHQDQLAASYIRRGEARSLREAFALANAAAPDIAKLAGLPIEQDYGAGPAETSHEAALRTNRATLVRQVAASALQRGVSQPDGYERAWVDSWFGVNVPPPPPVAGTSNQAELDRYNKERETFIERILEEARALLGDPAERAKLKPTKLGG